MSANRRLLAGSLLCSVAAGVLSAFLRIVGLEADMLVGLLLGVSIGLLWARDEVFDG